MVNVDEWLIWLGLFVGYFVLDLLGTRNVITIQRLKVIENSFLSAGTTAIATIGTYICVKDSLLNLIPISAGVWFGSYVALKWEIQIRRREAMVNYNLSSVKAPVKKRKRKGVHAKTKQSSNVGSKLYKKPSVGQGKRG